MRNIENETVFVPAHFNGCLVNRVPVLWLWRRYLKIGAFKDNERFSRFRGRTGLRCCRGTYAGGEKLGFVHDFAPFELLYTCPTQIAFDAQARSSSAVATSRAGQYQRRSDPEVRYRCTATPRFAGCPKIGRRPKNNGLFEE